MLNQVATPHFTEVLPSVLPRPLATLTFLNKSLV